MRNGASCALTATLELKTQILSFKEKLSKNWLLTVKKCQNKCQIWNPCVEKNLRMYLVCDSKPDPLLECLELHTNSVSFVSNFSIFIVMKDIQYIYRIKDDIVWVKNLGFLPRESWSFFPKKLEKQRIDSGSLPKKVKIWRSKWAWSWRRARAHLINTRIRTIQRLDRRKPCQKNLMVLVPLAT